MIFKKSLQQDGMSSRLKALVSVVFFLVGTWFYWTNVRGKFELDMYDWAYLFFFGGVGLYFLIRSFVDRKNEPFIEVNEDRLLLKSSSIEEVKEVFWERVRCIEQSDCWVVLIESDGRKTQIMLSSLSGADVDCFLEVLSEIIEKYAIDNCQ